MKYIVLIGRILFSLIFLMSVPNHFSAPAVEYATSKGVLMPGVLVPLAGILILIGGLSVLLGYKAKWGAWLLVLFLIPVSFWMHDFWNIADPMMRQMQMINFMKNMSLLGGSLIIAFFGSGPLSLDARRTKPDVEEHEYMPQYKKAS